MKRRNLQVVSKALLIAALLLFVAFHFLPMSNGFGDSGWTIWPDLWDIILHPQLVWRMRGADSIAIASFLMFSLLIPVSPFLIGVFLKSRLAWGFVTLFSGLSAFGFWIAIGAEATEQGAGLWCLLCANLLNFVGLLYVGGGRLPSKALKFPVP